MSLLLIIFGIATGCLLSILVGFLGREYNIGFGWAFLLSLIFTPIVGLIFTLLSGHKDSHERRSWGCLGTAMGLIVAFIIVAILLLLL
ncbi:MAG: hypothetical protein SNI51_02950 [Rikenellaceae bacterium]